MNLHCRKCLTGRTGDVLGEPCKTPGCEGIIEEVPGGSGVFRTLVDELPEPMTCGRRFDMYAGSISVHFDRQPGQDHWLRFKSNGNRVCSYCGSLHPDDFFAVVKVSTDSPESAAYKSVPEIEPSDKGYKIYVQQPGVRNALEGGIKFYTQHLPRNAEGKTTVSDEQNEQYGRAVRASRRRLDRYIVEIRNHGKLEAEAR